MRYEGKFNLPSWNQRKPISFAMPCCLTKMKRKTVFRFVLFTCLLNICERKNTPKKQNERGTRMAWHGTAWKTAKAFKPNTDTIQIFILWSKYRVVFCFCFRFRLYLSAQCKQTGARACASVCHLSMAFNKHRYIANAGIFAAFYHSIEMNEILTDSRKNCVHFRFFPLQFVSLFVNSQILFSVIVFVFISVVVVVWRVSNILWQLKICFVFLLLHTTCTSQQRSKQRERHRKQRKKLLWARKKSTKTYSNYKNICQQSS